MISSLTRTFGFLSHHPLARRHYFKSYCRFFYWQVKSRLNTGLTVMPFIEHTRFWAKKGLTGITGNIYAGLHEFNDMAFLLHFLRENDVFFDVGANVGSYTILAAGIKKSICLSFEPILASFEILEKNMELNNLGNLVTCKNVGVGDSERLVYFTNHEDTTNHVVEASGENTSAIHMVSLDSFFENYNPSLIKIDVEGFETAVINGAHKILNSDALKAIIIELNGNGAKYGFDESIVHKRLSDLNFLPYQYHPFERKLSLLKNFRDYNTIYIRDYNFVTERLESSLSFNIFGEKI